MNRQEMIIRAKELEHEYDTTKKPILRPTSVEDVDDRYQAMLEYNEWRREVIEEYSEIAKALGKPNAVIQAITGRITTPKQDVEVHFQVTGKKPLHELTSTNDYIPVLVDLLHPELQSIIKQHHDGKYIMCIFDRHYITIFCNSRKPMFEIVIEKITK